MKDKKLRISITISAKLHDKAMEYVADPEVDSNFSRLVSDLLKQKLGRVQKKN
jgi:hypothetical protein